MSVATLSHEMRFDRQWGKNCDFQHSVTTLLHEVGFVVWYCFVWASLCVCVRITVCVCFYSVWCSSAKSWGKIAMFNVRLCDIVFVWACLCVCSTVCVCLYSVCASTSDVRAPKTEVKLRCSMFGCVILFLCELVYVCVCVSVYCCLRFVCTASARQPLMFERQKLK